MSVLCSTNGIVFRDICVFLIWCFCAPGMVSSALGYCFELVRLCSLWDNSLCSWDDVLCSRDGPQCCGIVPCALRWNSASWDGVQCSDIAQCSRIKLNALGQCTTENMFWCSVLLGCSPLLALCSVLRRRCSLTHGWYFVFCSP